MNELEKKLHRTWVQLLAGYNHRELAAIAIDAELDILYDNWSPYVISVDLPPEVYGVITKNEAFKELMVKSIELVSDGYIKDQNGYDMGQVPVQFRMKLIDVEIIGRIKLGN